MPSTHTLLLYHLVFATKNREPVISAEWRTRLHEYLGGAVRGLGGTPQGVGGVADHVHLLVGLKATHRLSDFMRDLKKNVISIEFPFYTACWHALRGAIYFTTRSGGVASLNHRLQAGKPPALERQSM